MVYIRCTENKTANCESVKTTSIWLTVLIQFSNLTRYGVDITSEWKRNVSNHLTLSSRKLFRPSFFSFLPHSIGLYTGVVFTMTVHFVFTQTWYLSIYKRETFNQSQRSFNKRLSRRRGTARRSATSRQLKRWLILLGASHSGHHWHSAGWTTASAALGL